MVGGQITRLFEFFGFARKKLRQFMSFLFVLESAMGVKISTINELDDYRQEINTIGKLLAERLAEPWFCFNWAYNRFGNGKIEQKHVANAQQFTRNIINAKRKQFQANHKCELDGGNLSDTIGAPFKEHFAMLDTLLQAEQIHKKIDAAGIQEEVDTFVFEGFDTTMTAITFTLFMLATHPAVQAQLFDEINSLEDKNDIRQLKYLDAVIKETLRLYPPLPIIGRSLGEDTVIGKIHFNILLLSFRISVFSF